MVASVSSMPYQMIAGLGVAMGWLLGASCVTNCVPLVVPMVACSLIFCCLCDIMPKSRVCAKEQNLSGRIFAILLSWIIRAVLLVSCVLLAFCFSFGSDGGADLLREGDREGGRSVVEGGAGVADGDANEFDASLISLDGAKEGVVLLALLNDFVLLGNRGPFKSRFRRG